MIIFGTLIVVALGLSVVAWMEGWAGGYRKTPVWPDWALGAFGVFVVFVLFNGIAYAMVVDRAEKLTMYEEREAIYRARADEVVDEIREALLVVYPEYERDVFAAMSPANLDVYLVRYPELRAVEAVTEWTSQVRELLDKVYEQQSRAAGVRQALRWWSRNWAFAFPPALPTGQ